MASPKNNAPYVTGVPFARPPLAALRYLDPQPVTAWAPGTLDATHLPPKCIQVHERFHFKNDDSLLQNNLPSTGSIKK
jgi:carboxylesterase type B